MFKKLHTYTAIFHSSRRVFENHLTVLLKYAVYKRLALHKTVRVKCVAGGERANCE